MLQLERRYAVNTLKRDAGNYPLLPEPGGLPVFEPINQKSLARALDTERSKCDFTGDPFEEADYIEAEGRWIESWKDPTGHNENSPD